MDEELTMIIGPAPDRTLLRSASWIWTGTDPVVSHAMVLRRKFHHFLK